MQYLDLTLPGAAENLALDEALLEEAEAGDRAEVLRLWEPDRPSVVLGRSSRWAVEVHETACRELDIPVLRRISGGAAVLAGPGCLMYAVVLSYRRRPALRAVDQAHHFVLGTIVGALAAKVPGLRCRGISDLVVGDRKVSGNSLRAKREYLLYHGTLLYRFPLELIGRCLAMPPRQPGYREGRPHDSFVTNLPIPADELRAALRSAWEAWDPCPRWPEALTSKLAAQRYLRAEWNNQL